MPQWPCISSCTTGLPKATAVFKKARRAAPDDADVASRLADLYRQTNLIKDAIQATRQYRRG